MKAFTTIALASAVVLTASPTFAKSRQRVPVYSDSNPHYLDYRTDLSEARRELRKDLARADDAGDRADAWREYRREVADARYDFAKEMREKGVTVRTGHVAIEEY